MRFETRAQLHAWLEAEGLAHVARLNLEALAPWVDPSLWPQLRALGARRRLTDFAARDSLEAAARAMPTSSLPEVLPGVVERFLDGELEALQRARSQLGPRLAPPVDAARAGVHARLVKLRQGFPASVAARPEEALTLDVLTFDGSLPGLRFKDLLPSERALRAGGGFARPEVKLTLLEGASKVECSCGFAPCVHGLAAVDTALRWQHTAPPEQLAELSRPAWQRTLAALEKALEHAPPPVAATEVSWRVEVQEDVRVSPWQGKSRLSRAELLRLPGLTPVDQRVGALLPDEGEAAPRVLVDALVDHPRLVLASAPELQVRIERAPVGLVAEERLGSVKLGAALDGAPLPPHLAERVRRAKPDDLLFLWDEGPRQLTLLEVKAELQELLALVQREDAVFPPESYGALLTSLSKWAQRLPVAMPRSVLGEAVPATVLPVLRLEARSKGAVELEVRLRALPDAPAQLPGEGARDVHLRRGDKPMHAVRDSRREVTVAEDLCDELQLTEPYEHPFRFRFETPEPVLSLVEACSKRTPPLAVEWVGTPVRSLGSTGPRALRVQLQQRLEWFGVLGSLSVEGERVELARLIDAARRKARWVQVTEHDWVELNEVLRRHLERVADHVRVTKQGLVLGPAATEALRALEMSGASLEADEPWRSLAERLEAAKGHQPKLPKGLKATLRPYQLEGFQWLSRLAAWGAGAVLADDMGLGKTVQALALLLERAAKGPALVVAPTSVAFNWKEEAKRFAPSLKLHVYAELEDRAQPLGPGDVLVVSYGLLVRDAKALAARRFATALFDEAQNLKNAQTQRFHAAKAMQAGYRVALSGTPLENHLGELWSLFALVFPTLLGPWESFRERFALPIEQKIDPAAGPALARVIEPFLLRRTKAEVATELPPRTEVRVPVVLSAEEWQLYEDTRLAALSDLETPTRTLKEQQRKLQVLALLTRLRLVACHPKLYVADTKVASSKLTRLTELLEELRAEGQRALVFSQFTSHLDLVQEALEARGIGFVRLDGSTSRTLRQDRIREFDEGTAPVFLLSLKAGGVGLNLTAATNVIHLDPWWNPAVEDQASDRAHRLGQTRPVTIYRLVAMGTVEEQMLTLHARKRALVDDVLKGKGRAAKLSSAELVELLIARS